MSRRSCQSVPEGHKILALAFLLLIGVMLVAEEMGSHMDKAYIYFDMVVSRFVEMLNMRYRKKRQPVTLRHRVEDENGCCLRSEVCPVGALVDDGVFRGLVREHAATRQLDEATEGLASFRDKRPPRWYPASAKLAMRRPRARRRACPRRCAPP